jgi:hypothetical protein
LLQRNYYKFLASLNILQRHTDKGFMKAKSGRKIKSFFLKNVIPYRKKGKKGVGCACSASFWSFAEKKSSKSFKYRKKTLNFIANFDFFYHLALILAR